MTTNRKKLYHNFFTEQVEISPSINDGLNLPEFEHLKVKMENPYSKCHIEKETAFFKKYLKLIESIPKTQQTLHDKILKDICTNYLDSLKYEFDYFPLNPLDNDLTVIVDDIAGNGNFIFSKKKDYEAYLTKLDSFPEMVDSMISNMRKGIKTKNVLPKIIALDLKKQVKETLSNKSWININSKKYHGLNYNKICTGILETELSKMIDFLNKEYIPNCRVSIGMLALPNGKEKYEFLVKTMLTEHNISIDYIHQFGLLEVERIHKEMKHIQHVLQYKGTRKQFFNYMRNRKDLKFKSKKELLLTYKNKVKYIERNLIPTLFHTKIKSKCEVLAVPKYNEKFASEAYYQEGDINGKRPGKFFINLKNIKENSKIDVEALVLHEAMPGHHYQLSLVNEHHDYPMFIKMYGVESYMEGWALYCENLGEFKTNEDYFGKLVMELLRAIRLVVDTGIHYYGWSYKKTFNYIVTNGYETKELIESQIIRYISLPGQALAYKIGEKCFIDCLNKFLEDGGTDIRDFHTKVLEDGVVPLHMLREKFNIN